MRQKTIVLCIKIIFTIGLAPLKVEPVNKLSSSLFGKSRTKLSMAHGTMSQAFNLS